MASQVREPIGIALGLSEDSFQNANFLEIMYFTDNLKCKLFEGHQMDLRAFTDDSWHQMRQLQTISYDESLKGWDRALYAAKIFQTPMRILQYKVERILGLAEPISSYDELKMFLWDRNC